MFGRAFSALMIVAVLFGGSAEIARSRQEARPDLTALEDGYRAIVVSRGRQPDEGRLQQLLTLNPTNRPPEPPPTETVVGGRRALWVSRVERVARARRHDALRLDAVRSISPDNLSPAARLDWQVLSSLASTATDLDQYPTEEGFPAWADEAWRFDTLPAASAPEYREIIAWLRGVPLAAAEALRIVEGGVARGVVSNREHVEYGIESIRTNVPDDPNTSPYLAKFKQFPSAISAADQQALRDEATEIYRSQIVPAYARLLAYITTTYLPAARTAGMASLPNGPAWYAAILRDENGVQMTPDDIHQAGLAEVARAQERITEIARSVGFEGSNTQFFEKLRSDPRCAALDEAGVTREFTSITQRVNAGLPRLFRTVPQTPYRLVPTTSLPPSAAGAQARPGSLKDGRIGQVVVQIPATSGCAFFNIVLHEALPGHLLQMHVAAESAVISPFRRGLSSVAFSEGWAHYASGLSRELGLAPDPYTQAERAAGELFMAIRAVIDTGINARGWTGDEALAYFRQNHPVVSPQRASEIDAAINNPGRRLAYLVGERTIATLRAHAQAELGSQFDVRAFHDEVVGNGVLPLEVLDIHMREWIANRKSATRGAGR